jgi:hypothetical protein
VVLHHAEQLLAADQQTERVLVADVDDACAELRRLADEVVLKRAEHRGRTGIRHDRAGRVGLYRA